MRATVTGRRGGLRWLLRAVVLGLLPVMIVATPRVADAATYSDPVTATIDSGNWATGGTKCTITGYWSVTDTARVILSGSCGTGWQVSSSVVALEATGLGCSLTYNPGEVDGYPEFDGVMTGGECTVTELCYSVTESFHGSWASTDHTGCVPFALGAPPGSEPPGGSCKYGQLAYPATDHQLMAHPASDYVDTTQNISPTTPSGESATTKQWQLYVIWRSAAGGYLYVQGKSQNVSPTGPGVIGPHRFYNEFGGDGDELVGYGIMTDGTTNGTPWPQGFGGNTALYPNGYAGTTNEAECRFYWGEKVVNDPDSEQDEPIGPLGETSGGDPGSPDEPEVDPVPPSGDDGSSGCGFSISDPSSWASGGICKLVALVAKLIDVVAGLAKAIIDGIGALFLPGDGFMESKGEQLRDAWADTPPVVLVDGVGDVADSLAVANPGGSCQGPPVTFTEPVGNGSVTMHPFTACEGGMALLASIIKAALTVAVYVGGFLAAVRIIGGAFGLDLSIGKGAET